MPYHDNDGYNHDNLLDDINSFGAFLISKAQNQLLKV